MINLYAVGTEISLLQAGLKARLDGDYCESGTSERKDNAGTLSRRRI